MKKSSVDEGVGLGVAGFIVGLISFLLAVISFGFLGFFGVVGLVISIIQIKKKRRGMATAGVILSSLAILGFILFLIVIILLLIFVGSMAGGLFGLFTQLAMCFDADLSIVSHNLEDPSVTVGIGDTDSGIFEGINVYVNNELVRENVKSSSGQGEVTISLDELNVGDIIGVGEFSTKNLKCGSVKTLEVTLD
ncbi:hypothetical protein GOV14_02930 [Candidatus Pacearchaeota archaeon]|nr:hypothetical protein [Candidatus Pacearchaeota archaeon]